MIRIGVHCSIPEEELEFVASRSSGPGGQNVNKVSSRVTLRFNVESSPSLSRLQKSRLQDKLASRIGADGVLSIHSQRHRSQAMNRETVLARFVDLLAEAFKVTKARVRTRPTLSAEQRRLKEKARHGELKRLRAGRLDED